MSGKSFHNVIFSVFVPEGWNCFYGIDSEGKTTPKKTHIYKDAQDVGAILESIEACE